MSIDSGEVSIRVMFPPRRILNTKETFGISLGLYLRKKKKKKKNCLLLLDLVWISLYSEINLKISETLFYQWWPPPFMPNAASWPDLSSYLVRKYSMATTTAHPFGCIKGWSRLCVWIITWAPGLRRCLESGLGADCSLKSSAWVWVCSFVSFFCCCRC